LVLVLVLLIHAAIDKRHSSRGGRKRHSSWISRGKRRAARRRSVGVCIAGKQRSLLDALVLKSYKEQVQHVLMMAGWHVDTHITLVNEMKPACLNKSLAKLRATFAPASLSVVPLRTTEVWRPVPTCRSSRHPKFFLRIVRQWFALRICYEAIVKHERTHGVAYDWLLRTRTDIVFLAPIPLAVPLSPLNNSHAYVPVSGMTRMESYRCMNDQVFLCPRHLCRPYFMLLELWSSRHCNSMANSSSTANASFGNTSSGAVGTIFAKGASPSGQSGPPSSAFTLPASPMVNEHHPSIVRTANHAVTAQWYYFARYVPAPATPCTFSQAEAQCCGLLRTIHWPYGIKRPLGYPEPLLECSLRLQLAPPSEFEVCDSLTHICSQRVQNGSASGEQFHRLKRFPTIDLRAYEQKCTALEQTDRSRQPVHATIGHPPEGNHSSKQASVLCEDVAIAQNEPNTTEPDFAR
jgi:hypothetical protein